MPLGDHCLNLDDDLCEVSTDFELQVLYAQGGVIALRETGWTTCAGAAGKNPFQELGQFADRKFSLKAPSYDCWLQYSNRLVSILRLVRL